MPSLTTARAALLLVLFTGCSHRPATRLHAPDPSASAAVASPGAASASVVAVPPPATPDATPRVIRRIVAEQRDLVQRSLQMAAELPDPRGRQRALDEANALAAELARIEAPIDGADSAALDEAVTKLQLLDTRIALLHEGLRTATERTTAVLIE